MLLAESVRLVHIRAVIFQKYIYADQQKRQKSARNVGVEQENYTVSHMLLDFAS